MDINSAPKAIYVRPKNVDLGNVEDIRKFAGRLRREPQSMAQIGAFAIEQLARLARLIEAKGLDPETLDPVPVSGASAA